MRKLVKFMVAVLLALCLPLQGVAGVTMPACAGHVPMAPAAAGVADMDAYCEHAKPSHSGETDKTSHDKCFACSLNVAQAIIPSVISVVSSGVIAKYSAMAENKYQTSLSPPFHPPKSTLALG